MEKLIKFNNGVSSLDLTADYKELKLDTYDQLPSDYFILNSNNKISVLKQIKTSDEHLWILSMLLDKKTNGKLTAKILPYNLWCSKCRSDVKSYSFDMKYKFYEAINTGLSHRCIKCTEENLRFYNHPKFSMNYKLIKYGNNYVHQRDFYNDGNIEYTVLTDNQYTMFKFSTYNIKYHHKIEPIPEEKNNLLITKIECTVCGIKSLDFREHNETCIKNMNNFALQIYNQKNLLMRSLDDIHNDIKNLITNNLIIIIKFNRY